MGKALTLYTGNEIIIKFGSSDDPTLALGRSLYETSYMGARERRS